MLKHFSTLVCETASKAKFLQAFQRKRSSGLLPAPDESGNIEDAAPWKSTKAEPFAASGSIKAEQDTASNEDVKAEPQAAPLRSSPLSADCPAGSVHISEAPVPSTVNVKDESLLKGEPEEQQSGRGQFRKRRRGDDETPRIEVKEEVNISSSSEDEPMLDADPAADELSDMVKGYGSDKAQTLQRLASNSQAGGILRTLLLPTLPVSCSAGLPSCTSS